MVLIKISLQITTLLHKFRCPVSDTGHAYSTMVIVTANTCSPGVLVLSGLIPESKMIDPIHITEMKHMRRLLNSVVHQNPTQIQDDYVSTPFLFSFLCPRFSFWVFYT